MSQNIELFEQYLNKNSLSSTGARRKLYLAILRTQPVTLAALTKELGVSVNRASIYRNIDILEKIGVLRRIQIGWKYKLEVSEAFSDHHHHLLCTHCEVIIPIKESAILENSLLLLARSNNFAMKSHQVEITGLCQNCRAS